MEGGKERIGGGGGGEKVQEEEEDWRRGRGRVRGREGRERRKGLD